MTDGTKNGGKGNKGGGDAPEPEAPAEKQVRQASRYSRAEHIAAARGAYGVSAPMVAAGIATLDEGKAYPDGYTNDEVKAGIERANSTEIKEG